MPEDKEQEIKESLTENENAKEIKKDQVHEQAEDIENEAVVTDGNTGDTDIAEKEAPLPVAEDSEEAEKPIVEAEPIMTGARRTRPLKIRSLLPRKKP